jgi:hypothetical protein
MSPLPLELGQVSDPVARRALEQVSLRWPLPLRVPVVISLPVTTRAIEGMLVYLSQDEPPDHLAGLHVSVGGVWVRV